MNLRVPSDPNAQRLAQQWPELEEGVARTHAKLNPAPRLVMAAPLSIERAGLNWSASEEIILKAAWPSKMSMSRLRTLIDRPADSITAKAGRMGLKRK